MAVHFGTTSADGPGVMQQMDSDDVSLSTRQGKASQNPHPYKTKGGAPPFDRSKVSRQRTPRRRAGVEGKSKDAKNLRATRGTAFRAAQGRSKSVS